MAPSRFRRQLNPAFAAAHGLTESSSEDGPVTISPSKASGGAASPSDQVSSSVISSRKRVEQAIALARKTGKLNASNLGLFTLSDDLFDMRKGIQVNYSLSASSSSTDRGSHGEETLTLVDFSDNPLGSKNEPLDERILGYPAVQTLRLRRCELVSAINFKSLENLSLLDLSGNALTNFSFEHVPSTIQHLNLASNKLEVLEGSDAGNMLQLPFLNSLDVSENCLANLPVARVLQCPKLQIFKCRKNQLKELPIHDGSDAIFLIGSCKFLQTLDASQNRITTVMDFSNAFPALQTLHLSENQLRIPPCLPPNVTQVSLVRNKIKSIGGLLPAAEVGVETESENISALVDLLLADNQLEVLDADVVKRLHHLHRLDIQANVLKSLPYELGFLPHLHYVSLTGNPLISFKSAELTNTQSLLSKLRKRAPSDKGNNISVASNTRKTGCSQLLLSTLAHNPNVITLKGSGLQEIPPELLEELEMSQQTAFAIKGVNLENNQIQSVPEKFINMLPSLSVLCINQNRLASLPKNLGNASLVELSLSRNLLTSEVVKLALFCDEIDGGVNQSRAMFKTLQVLDLSTNRMNEFPGFAAFSSLRTLTLSGNKIKSVQNWTSFPRSLEVLNLSENSISDMGEMPLVLKAYCAKFNSLFMRHNDLKQIPATLGLLDTIKFLDLKGNPQRLVRANILDKSGGEIIVYLYNRLTPEQLLSVKSRVRDIVAMSSTRQELNSMSPVATSDTSPDASDCSKASGEKENSKQVTISVPQISHDISPVGDKESYPLQKKASPAVLDAQVGLPCKQQGKSGSNVKASAHPSKEEIAHEQQDKSETESSQSIVIELQQNILALSQQLERLGLSQAKRYALKKQLAMERSKLIREERRLAH